MSDDNDDEIIVKDSNGTRLADGDSVTLIKDLKVKGTSVTLKRGQMCRNIRLTDDTYPHYKDRAKRIAVSREGRQQFEEQMAREREEREARARRGWAQDKD